jgi:hypothetical protein
MAVPARKSEHRTVIEFPIHIRKVEAAMGGNLADHDETTVNILFDLVFAGVNKNGDLFTEEELKQAFKTLELKPIDWEHDEPNIGVITHAEYKEPMGSIPAHITCQGTLWAWRYPEYVDLVVASAKLGEVGLAESADYAMSMEAYFEDANYIIGDYEQVIPMSQDSGELEFLRGRTIGGKPVSRELIHVIFGGAGVTEKPAERMARLKAVASNKSLGDGKELLANLDDSDFALQSMRLFPIDRRDRVEASLQYFDTVVKSLGGSEDGDAQVSEAHERLLLAAESFGIDVSKHSCSVCSNHSDDVKEESEAVMTKDKILDEASEQTQELEASADAETEVTEEVTEATEEEATVESEIAEAVEDIAELAEAEDMPQDGMMGEIKAMLQEILAAVKGEDNDEDDTSEASDESDTAEASDEKDEMTLAAERINELEAELKRVREEHLGFLRLSELTKAGVQVPEDEIASKQEFLASFTEDQWNLYLNDVKNARQSSAASEDSDEEKHETVAHLNLEDDTSDVVTSYRKFWSSTSIFS